MKSRPPSEIVKKGFLLEFVALDTKRTARRVCVSDNGPYVNVFEIVGVFRHASGTPQKA